MTHRKQIIPASQRSFYGERLAQFLGFQQNCQARLDNDSWPDPYTTGLASVSGDTLRGSHSPSDELPTSLPSSTITLPLSIVFTG